MKTTILLTIVLFIFLTGCSSNSFNVETINTAPRNNPNDYWRALSVRVLKDAKIPGKNVRKVDYEYHAGVLIDGVVDSEKLLRERGADAVIISEVVKNDGDYKSLIYTDDFDGLKMWLAEN